MRNPPLCVLIPSIRIGKPEDLMRKLSSDGASTVNPTAAIASTREYASEEAEASDFILGFSEGASVAASVVLHQAKTHYAHPFRGDILICCSPSYDVEGQQSMLADERLDKIGIPTLHIVGAADPSRFGGLALYNVCDGGEKFFFDHGKGHTIPWETQKTQAIGAAMSDMMDQVVEGPSPGSQSVSGGCKVTANGMDDHLVLALAARYLCSYLGYYLTYLSSLYCTLESKYLR